jgi:hypothetical protein
MMPGRAIRGFELNGSTGKHTRPDLVDRISLVCSDTTAAMVIYYRPDRSDSIMPADFWDATLASLTRRMTSMSLSADNAPDFARYPRAAVTVVGTTADGHLAVAIPIAPPVEAALRGAKRLGVYFEVDAEVWPGQPSLVPRPMRPMFHETGFFAELEDGRAKINGFLNNCR